DVAQLLATFTKIPNGITAFDNTQTLVIRDYASNVKRMMEVIERVDVTRESEYRFEVIPIRYGKVMDLYSTMGSLISGGGGGGFAGTTGTTGGAATRTQRPQRGIGGMGNTGYGGQTGLGGVGSYGAGHYGRQG